MTGVQARFCRYAPGGKPAGRPAYRAGWQMLGAELTRRRAALIRVAAWSVPEAVPDLLSGLLVARALDSGFLVDHPLAGLGWLAVLGLGYLGKAVATRMSFPWLCATIEPLRDSLVAAVVGGTLRRPLDASPASDSLAGVARLTSQVETVRQLSAALIRTLRPLAVGLAAAVAGLMVLSPIVAALVAPPLLLALLVFRLSLRGMSRLRGRMVTSAEHTAQEVGTVLAGLRDVIACGAQERAAGDVGDAIDAQAHAMRSAAWAGTIRIAVLALGYYLPLLGLLIAAPWLVRRGGLTPGQVIGAITYLTLTMRPALATLTVTVGGWGIQLGTVLQRLNDTCVPPPAVWTQQQDFLPDGYEMRTEALTFAYAATAEPVIRDLAVLLAPDEHLAIVGPSGIGKSTLAVLLAGLRAGYRGEISLGGVPLGRIDERDLRRRIALVPQEAYVFTGTLRENLTYLRPGATSAQLDACAAAIGLTALVDQLGGYDVPLSGETVQRGLSDGERQLIALGRVYLSDARVVILDEATCHLEPEAEARAELAFAARGGSLLVIAHRISSALRAQRVLVLDGTSAVLGTHAELLTASPLYADLAGQWAGPVSSPG